MGEEYESISIVEFFKEVRKGVWICIALTLLFAIIFAGVTIATEETVYQATSTIVIGKESARLFYEDKYTQSDILMYEKIANTYVEIAKSQFILDKVVRRFPKYTSDQIRAMIVPEAVVDTLILKFTTTGKNSTEVADISNAYTDIMVEECSNILPVGSLEVLDHAEYPRYPIGSKIVRNTVLGFLFGGFVACIILLIRMIYRSRRITTSDQIEKYLGIQVRSILQ